MISACVLHNLCVQYNDDIDEFVEQDMSCHPNQFENVYHYGHAGILRRLQLVNIPKANKIIIKLNFVFIY